MFTYGGLRGSALLDDFLLADDSTGSADLSVCDPRSQAWYGPPTMVNCSPAYVHSRVEAHAPEQPPNHIVTACSTVAGYHTRMEAFICNQSMLSYAGGNGWTQRMATAAGQQCWQRQLLRKPLQQQPWVCDELARLKTCAALKRTLTAT